MRFLLFVLLISPCLSAGEIIDEILATVDRSPILRSDIVLAGLVGLGELEAEEMGERSSRHIEILNHRIDLEIQFQNIKGVGALRSLRIDQKAELERLIERAGGEEKLRMELNRHDLQWQDLEALAYRIAAARAWVRERIRPRIRVRKEEIDQAYLEDVVIPLREKGDPPPPIGELYERLKKLVEERKVNVAIREWITQARQLHEVIRFSDETPGEMQR